MFVSWKNNNTLGGQTTYTLGGSLFRSPPSAVQRIFASAKDIPGLKISW